MSKDVDAHNALRDRIIAVLPSDYNRLYDPYTIELNSEKALRKGWGLGYGEAENTNRQLNAVTDNRTYIVTLTRRNFVRELDTTGKETVEAALMDDRALVRNDVESDPTLGVSGLAGARFIGDSGVLPVFSDKDNYRMIQLLFGIEFFTDTPC